MRSYYKSEIDYFIFMCCYWSKFVNVGFNTFFLLGEEKFLYFRSMISNIWLDLFKFFIYTNYSIATL